MDLAVLSAMYYWGNNGLNKIADNVSQEDSKYCDKLTYRINIKGLEKERRYEIEKKAFLVFK